MEDKSKEKQEETTALSIATPGDIFALIDTDELIDSLKQRITGDWIYEIDMDGKKVRGVSADGASEIATFIAYKSKGQYIIRAIQIQDRKETAEKCEAEVLAGIFATAIINGKVEYVLLDTNVGFATQNKVGQKRAGGEYVVKAPMTQAVVKAQRNAFNRLIPSKVRETVIEVALKLGKVREGEDETENGHGEKATDKQLAYIRQLLKSSKISEDERKLFEEDLDTLTKKEAGKRITLLQTKTMDPANQKGSEKQKGFFQ